MNSVTVGLGNGFGKTRRIRPSRLPTSYGQQRLWFLEHLEGPSSANHYSGAHRLRGDLNIEALFRSINVIIQRHESLRTCFREQNGEPLQLIAPTLHLQIPLVDLCDGQGRTPAEALKDQLRNERTHPFDLTSGPLVRAKLFKLGVQDHVFSMVVHHIVYDAWSQGLFHEELSELYKAFRNGGDTSLEEPPTQYGDFSLQQRKWFGGKEFQAGLEYWKEQLKGAPTRIHLPVDGRPSDEVGFDAATYYCELTPELMGKVRSFSRASGSTTYMTMLAAFAVLLWRYGGKDDFVVGTPIANRAGPALAKIIGFFVNSLAIRVRPRPWLNFSEFLATVRETLIDAYDRQDIPFDAVVRELAPHRQSGRTPFLQINFALQNSRWVPLRLDGIDVSQISPGEERSAFDLDVQVIAPRGDSLLSWRYNRNMFEAWRAEQMARHYIRILKEAVENSGAAIGTLRFLDQSPASVSIAQRHQVETGSEVALAQLFEAQAAKTPTALALACAGEESTYESVNRRANQIAHWIIRHRLKSEDVVVIALERTVDTVIAVLGALKARRVFLLLDIRQPGFQLEHLLKQINPAAAIADRNSCKVLQSITQDWIVPTLDLNSLAGEVSAPNPTVDSVPCSAKLVCLSYSPRGGKPGSVAAVTQEALDAFFPSLSAALSIQPGDRHLMLKSVFLDLSVFEIVGPMCRGAAVLLAWAGDPNDQSRLRVLMQSCRPSAIYATPSDCSTLLALNALQDGKALFFVGGEQLPRQISKRLLDTGSEVWQLYGAAEAGVWTIMRLLEGNEFSSGSADIKGFDGPVPHSGAYILSSDLEPVPPGVIADLYIRAHGLARGYWNDSRLTAERFLPDPYGMPGARMFRTGDVVRECSSGRIDVIGPPHMVVDVNGFKVDLRIIEEALEALPGVWEAVAILKPDGFNKKRPLLAYVTPVESHLDVMRLGDALKKVFPDYMVPEIQLAEEIPRTPTGKFDRAALVKRPIVSRRTSRPPQTSQEQAMCALFSEVLGVDKVGLDDDFFEMGGHSLLAIRLNSRVRARFGVEIPLKTLFIEGTVDNLIRKLNLNTSQ